MSKFKNHRKISFLSFQMKIDIIIVLLSKPPASFDVMYPKTFSVKIKEMLPINKNI
jgi:hypothetical protein